MARSTHDRQHWHEGVDLDTNIEIDGDIGTYLSGTTLHQLIQLFNSGFYVTTSGFHITASGFFIHGLPTADPSELDQVWNDSGTLKISSG
jgi:hypothetical protein